MKYFIRHKILILNALFFVFSILLLIYPALINGYPLVYSDSGAYIASGFDNHVPVDRPIMYAFFVRHISMASSLWFVIVMQAIIVAVTCLVTIKYILKTEKYFLLTFISIAFLSITTGISYYVSQIMPDIFSAIAIISLCLLICFENLNKYLKLTFAILLVFSNMAHSSNLMTSTFIVFSLILLRLFFKKYFTQNIKRVFLVTSLVFVQLFSKMGRYSAFS